MVAEGKENDTSVRVALRVRPLTAKETLAGCAECVSFYDSEPPQILLGSDRPFSFDYVFTPEHEQIDVYDACVSPLMLKFVEGYNSTILAYGQTGSGKTFSMGTGLGQTTCESQGIVPRAIYHLFDLLKELYPHPSSATVAVSFLELYNEELIDLLNPSKSQPEVGSRPNTASTVRSDSTLRIREDENGKIVWVGVREEECQTPEQLLGVLAKGSLCRTTGSTDMNMVSSRSHAIFSISLRICKITNIPSTIPDDYIQDILNIKCKFHFVDLAGSERLKRTLAEGARAKESISINSGLLALGNVISALGDETKHDKLQIGHVPYRDSKLTRLLQDSLGGNSQTLMLACISPADTNFQETLNTLKYANRARNIKNKVSINQESSDTAIQVQQLRTQIARLKLELSSLREHVDNCQFYKNNEFTRGRTESQGEKKIERLEHNIEQLSMRIQQLESEINSVTAERDVLLHLQQGIQLPNDLNLAESSISLAESAAISENGSCSTFNDFSTDNPIIFKYIAKITELKSQINIQASELEFLRRQASQTVSFPAIAAKRSRESFNTQEDKVDETIERAKECLRQDLQGLLQSSKALESDETDVHEQLNKLQADISIKQELIATLETTHAEYVAMKRNFEAKLDLLQNNISSVETERDQALEMLKSGQDRRQVESKYEARVKRLLSEISELRKSHVEATKNISTRKADYVIKQLKVNVEALKTEKNRLMRRMRDDAERARSNTLAAQRELLALRRKERMATEAAKKYERSYELQKLALKRRSDEVIATHRKLKTVTELLKRSSIQKTIMKQFTRLGKNLSPKDSNYQFLVSSNTSAGASPVFKSRELAEAAIAIAKRNLQANIEHVVAHQQLANELEGLVLKNKRLEDEKLELLKERERVVLASAEKTQTEPDHSAPQYMDDRLELIDAEIVYIQNRLVKAKEPRESIDSSPVTPTNEQGYEQICRIVCSLGHAEAIAMLQNIIDEYIQQQVERRSQAAEIASLEEQTEQLRRNMLVMRHTALNNAVDYEKRLKKIELQQMIEVQPQRRRPPSEDVFERLAKTFTVSAQAKVRDPHVEVEMDNPF